MNRARVTSHLLILLCLPGLFCPDSRAQVAPGFYIIQFTDKAGNQAKLEKPGEFLSARALARRARLHIAPDSTDLPVSWHYLDSLRHIGLQVACTSRWFNLAVVETEDLTKIEKAKKFPFVLAVRKACRTPDTRKALPDKWTKETFSGSLFPDDASDYGGAFTQIHLHKGDTLHTLGFRGKGIQIAVLDAGFYHADTLPAFKKLYSENRVIATHDFVAPGTNVYEDHPHGMQVLSIMAGDLPGRYIGTAPEASYYLLRTENTASEYILEEYYWAAAAEYADSAGADMIHASLGYTVFDDPSQNHTYADMNGKSAPVSRAASMAVRKGIMVVVSAGNEGNSSWKYISAPADADSILSIGAITASGTLASFSSRGPSSDGRIKPDAVALGVGTYIQNPSGTFSYGNGTSFASPVITGLTACLWQAVPSLSPVELRTAILMSASQYNKPDSLKGYGIPDFSQAMEIAMRISRMKTDSGLVQLFPNPAADYITLCIYFVPPGEITLEIFTVSGSLTRKIIQKGFQTAPVIIPLNIQNLRPGVYFLRYTDPMHQRILRFIKQ